LVDLDCGNPQFFFSRPGAWVVVPHVVLLLDLAIYPVRTLLQDPLFPPWIGSSVRHLGSAERTGLASPSPLALAFLQSFAADIGTAAMLPSHSSGRIANLGSTYECIRKNGFKQKKASSIGVGSGVLSPSRYVGSIVMSNPAPASQPPLCVIPTISQDSGVETFCAARNRVRIQSTGTRGITVEVTWSKVPLTRK
jgi:hypothetical protein